MGKLIDADDLIGVIQYNTNYKPNKSAIMADELIRYINRQPTAYDVDKVWNEITDRAGKATTKGAYRTYWECAKIVKGAVKDE